MRFVVILLFGSSVDDSQAVAGLVIVVQRALACPQDQQNSQKNLVKKYLEFNLDIQPESFQTKVKLELTIDNLNLFAISNLVLKSLVEKGQN